MLLPTQQSAATITTSLVGSILKDVEKRQAEEEEKAKGTKDDKVLKALIKSDDTRKVASDKINAHFFDRTQGGDKDTRTTLILKIAKAAGLDPDDFESTAAFGRAVDKMIENLTPEERAKLEEQLGLDKLGLSIIEFVGALKNPGGQDDEKLKRALGETSDSSAQSLGPRAKAVERLKSAAEPSSLDEAQIDSLRSDPTRGSDKRSLDDQESLVRGLQLKDELKAVADRRKAEQAQLIRVDEIGRYSLASQSF